MSTVLEHARKTAELKRDDPTVQHNLRLAEYISGDRAQLKIALEKARLLLRGATGESLPKSHWWQRF